MTADLLAVISTVSAAVGLGVVAFLAIKLVGIYGQLGNARDALDAQKTLVVTVTAERDSDKTALDAERAKTAELRDRLATAESARNAAYQQARDHVVDQIKKSNLADAAKLVDDMLSRPLPGSVPPQPAPAAAPAPAADGGGQAGTVQPAHPPASVAAGDRLP